MRRSDRKKVARYAVQAVKRRMNWAEASLALMPWAWRQRLLQAIEDARLARLSKPPRKRFPVLRFLGEPIG